MQLTTHRGHWHVLKTVGADDTAIDWAGTDQTCDNVTTRGSTVDAVELPPHANAGLVLFHGTDTADETMAWMLVGWRGLGGPAEFIANGTATLGTQQLEAATTTGLYADTIAITAQKWPSIISIVDSGNNRVAKLVFDLCGIKHIACVMQKTTTATTGAKIAWF